MDRVVQAFLEAHRSHQQHMSKEHNRASERAAVKLFLDRCGETHLDPGGREMYCASPLWMELLQ